MELGKNYKILGESDSHRPELEPHGTVVKCIEVKGNGTFIVKLIDKCDRNINKGTYGWLINNKDISYIENN